MVQDKYASLSTHKTLSRPSLHITRRRCYLDGHLHVCVCAPGLRKGWCHGTMSIDNPLPHVLLFGPDLQRKAASSTPVTFHSWSVWTLTRKRVYDTRCKTFALIHIMKRVTGIDLYIYLSPRLQDSDSDMPRVTAAIASCPSLTLLLIKSPTYWLVWVLRLNWISFPTL